MTEPTDGQLTARQAALQAEAAGILADHRAPVSER